MPTVSSSIHCQVRVGLRVGESYPPKRFELDDLIPVVDDIFPNYTLIPTHGRYKKTQEPSIIVDLLFEVRDGEKASEVTSFCYKFNKLVDELLRKLKQRSVMISVRVNHPGKPEIAWMATVKKSEVDKQAVFPLPSEVARYLLPKDASSKLPLLYKRFAEHYSRLGLDARLKKAPVAFFRAPPHEPFEFRKGEQDTRRKLWLDWDKKFARTTRKKSNRRLEEPYRRYLRIKGSNLYS